MLRRLVCDNNQLGPLLDVSNTALEYLSFTNNPSVVSLDASNTNFTVLNCYGKGLTSLDVSGISSLQELHCHNNQLTSLDVTTNTNLNGLVCNDNQLTSLDLSNNINFLGWVKCSNNQLTSLILPPYNSSWPLNTIWCNNNLFTSLDFSHSLVSDLRCNNNYFLTNLNLQNGHNSFFVKIDASVNPHLNCVQVDDNIYSFVNWSYGANNPDFTFDNIVTFVIDTSFCPPPVSIQEHTTNKKLIRTIDLLGRETKNQPLFYIYDDGTVEKRIVIE
jgi:hypothetical protein